jgi:hypothetical protein
MEVIITKNRANVNGKVGLSRIGNRHVRLVSSGHTANYPTGGRSWTQVTREAGGPRGWAQHLNLPCADGWGDAAGGTPRREETLRMKPPDDSERGLHDRFEQHEDRRVSEAGRKMNLPLGRWRLRRGRRARCIRISAASANPATGTRQTASSASRATPRRTETLRIRPPDDSERGLCDRFEQHEERRVPKTGRDMNLPFGRWQR